MPNQVWKEEVEPETLLKHFGEESDEELDYTYASIGLTLTLTPPSPSPNPSPNPARYASTSYDHRDPSRGAMRSPGRLGFGLGLGLGLAS